jgi:GNAT superfamily N-acetyltransferase
MDVVRQADSADADSIGRLLHDFNAEYDEPTPGPQALAERIRDLLAAGEITVLLSPLAGEPAGLAVLRFRPALWSNALECYVEELYVRADLRGRGMGRALMEAVIAAALERGADRIDVGTGADDTVARALYESLGFSHRGGNPEGAVNYFYERALL